MRKPNTPTLGMAIADLLMESEPSLLVCDLAATGRMAAVLADVLGGVMATVLALTPNEYPDFFEAVCARINKTALCTVEKAGDSQIQAHRTLQ